MNIAILVTSVGDYKVDTLSAPKAQFYLGQISQLLSNMPVSYKIDVYARHGMTPEDVNEDTPLDLFRKEIAIDKNDFRLIPLREYEGQGKYDVLFLALNATLTHAFKVMELIKRSKCVIYFESDGEPYLPVEWNTLSQNLFFNPFFIDVRDKFLVLTTVLSQDYQTIFRKMGLRCDYLPTVPMNVMKRRTDVEKTKFVQHIRVLNHGSILPIAEAISTPIAPQKRSISSPISLPLSKMTELLAQGKYLMPGTGAYVPSLKEGLRFTSKTWESYLANCIYLFPVLLDEWFDEYMKDYPIELRIPMYMTKEDIKKWIVRFKCFDAVLSENDRQSIQQIVISHNRADIHENRFRQIANRIFQMSQVRVLAKELT